MVMYGCSMPSSIKVGTTGGPNNDGWRTVSNVFINVGGVWKTVSNAYIKVGTTGGPNNDGWRLISGGATIESTVTISQSTPDATSGLITLTGTNKHWLGSPTDRKSTRLNSSH